MALKVILYLSSPLTFTFPIDSGPYPWLDSVGTKRAKVRAGHIPSIGANETPSIDFNLNNVNNVASTLIGIPLRKKVEVYDDNDKLFFSGLVSKIAYGSVLIVSSDA